MPLTKAFIAHLGGTQEVRLRYMSVAGGLIMASDPEIKRGLAARLAQKTGLSQDDAQKFLDALPEVAAQEEPDPNPAHAITIPLVQQEDGTLMVDMSGHSAWWPFKKTKKDTTTPSPIKKRGPFPGQGPFPGAYPGPSVSIKVDDWLGADLKLDESALDRLRGALVKADIPKSAKKMLGHGLIDHENEL